jgi:hypothetical protein
VAGHLFSAAGVLHSETKENSMRTSIRTMLLAGIATVWIATPAPAQVITTTTETVETTTTTTEAPVNKKAAPAKKRTAAVKKATPRSGSSTPAPEPQTSSSYEKTETTTTSTLPAPAQVAPPVAVPAGPVITKETTTERTITR